MRLRVSELTSYYGKKRILDKLNLTLDEGMFGSLLGVSGSGKSTLLKCIAGIVCPSHGDIFLEEKAITKKPIHLRKIAYIFQEALLFPHMSVYENIAFGLSLKKDDKSKIHEKVLQIAKEVNVSELLDRYPHSLSGGQEQRVALGRALAIEPRILLMDEPFSSLDPHLREKMGRLLKDIQKNRSLTILFVTHDVHEAVFLSDRLFLLDSGMIIQEGSAIDVYERPKSVMAGQMMGHLNVLKNGLCLRPHHLRINLEKSDFEIIRIEQGLKGHMVWLSRGDDTLVVECMSNGKKISLNQRVGYDILAHDRHYLRT